MLCDARWLLCVKSCILLKVLKKVPALTCVLGFLKLILSHITSQRQRCFTSTGNNHMASPEDPLHGGAVQTEQIETVDDTAQQAQLDSSQQVSRNYKEQ
jgi:hypothetical protein